MSWCYNVPKVFAEKWRTSFLDAEVLIESVIFDRFQMGKEILAHKFEARTTVESLIFVDCLYFTGSWGRNFVYPLKPTEEICRYYLNLLIRGGY